MNARYREILGEIDFYSEQLHDIGHVLVELIRSKYAHPQLLEETGDAYRLLTIDLVELYSEAKRSAREAHALSGMRQDPKLEFLEEIFIRYRNLSENTEAELRKAEGSSAGRSHARAIKKLRLAFEAFSKLAENAAKAWVLRANGVSEWTVEKERRIGLRRWLR